MPRLNIERQNKLEPKRMEFAKKEIEKLGYAVVRIGKVELNFMYKNEPVAFFPYSGWHAGKSIKDGRGIKNLLKQLKNEEE